MADGIEESSLNSIVTTNIMNSPNNLESLPNKPKTKQWEDCLDTISYDKTNNASQVLKVDPAVQKLKKIPYTDDHVIKKSNTDESVIIHENVIVKRQGQKSSLVSERLRTDVLSSSGSDAVIGSSIDQPSKSTGDNQIIMPDDLVLSHSSINLPIVACHEEIEASQSDPTSCPLVGQDLTTTVSKNVGSYEMSPQEMVRRERVRQRKMAQRQNAAFRDRERLKAKERMKALRNDPVYRYHERQRDRERRKMARLNNQAQRAREREKDRVRKCLTRSLNSEKASEDVHLTGFQLLLGVSESEDEEERDVGLPIVWETG